MVVPVLDGWGRSAAALLSWLEGGDGLQEGVEAVGGPVGVADPG